MPHASYLYGCDCRVVGGGRPECHTCGRPGRFVGYHKSVVEYWGAYNKVTGLNPLGPDPDVPPDIREAIGKRIVYCQLCGGEGYLSTDPASWTHCPRCEGDGYALEGHFTGNA